MIDLIITPKKDGRKPFTVLIPADLSEAAKHKDSAVYYQDFKTGFGIRKNNESKLRSNSAIAKAILAAQGSDDEAAATELIQKLVQRLTK